MPPAGYDVIVLGAGGVGSAAMWQSAKRGLRVLGIDRYEPPHDRGSSHGQTRIIRQAYFEHPDYVPLLLESYRLWEELEQLDGRALKVECGLIEIGPAEGVVVPGVLHAAQRHGLDVERLSPGVIATEFPAFHVPASLAGVFEARAGFLHVERCVQACLAAAARCGAELLCGVQALDWSAGREIEVRTSAGVFRTERLIVTSGAWAGSLLGSVGVDLRILRKVLLWFDAAASTHLEGGCPCFLFELPAGTFYGFPQIDQRGLKAAEHTGGDVVDDPLQVDRELGAADREPVERFLRDHLPAATGKCIAHAVCLYTMSPDGHFIVDRHPIDPRIAFAAGLSGHGYKFAPILGKALVELAVAEKATCPIEFLSLRRFGSTG